MKVAVSIPDAVFAEAERLAAELGTSRSDLYRRALEEFVGRHAPAQVTATLDRLFEDLNPADAREFVRRAGRHALSRSEW
jgi:metal-responsive CopG/Arc/MetJ family transcriptional regulator